MNMLGYGDHKIQTHSRTVKVSDWCKNHQDTVSHIQKEIENFNVKDFKKPQNVSHTMLKDHINKFNHK